MLHTQYSGYQKQLNDDSQPTKTTTSSQKKEKNKLNPSKQSKQAKKISLWVRKSNYISTSKVKFLLLPA